MEPESDSDCVQVENIKVASLNALPTKSRARYETAYKWFMDWKKGNRQISLSEEVLLAYFEEISIKFKPTSLWALYSMLKLTLNINNNVNIDGYTKLKDFLKSKAKNYTPKESKTLTTSQIEQFITEASDEEYLCIKVALIFGVVGGCRKRELYLMTTSHLEDFGTAVLITIPSANSKMPRNFIVNGKYYDVYKKYANLRPLNVQHPNFFLSYSRGKCATHKMGINKFGILGKLVAKYLKLPNAALYKGYFFRRSTPAFLTINEDITSLKIPNTYPTTVTTVNENSGPVSTNVGSTTQDEKESPSLPECEINDHSVGDDPLADDIYQEVEEDDESETDEKNFICDVTENEVSVNSEQNICPKQCDLFGEYISKHLQRLPLETALRLQSGIQALVLQTRLEYIREHPNEAPIMVKEENPDNITTPAEDPIIIINNNNNDDNRVQNGAGKRPQKKYHQEPALKRFKSNKTSDETNKSNKLPKRNERTEFAVFGEHIALQLERLPEVVSLQLQTEIFDLITQTFLKQTDDDPPDLVEIKDEVLEMEATELLDL